jgi:YfiR/HmsC-like
MRPQLVSHARVAAWTWCAWVSGSFTNAGVVHWVASFAILVCLLLDGGGQLSRAQSSDEEYRVKAAFIFHFGQLVDWPSDTPIDTEKTLWLCTLAEDRFQGALEDSVSGKVIGNRVMRIRQLAEAQDLQSCQILFIGKGQSRRIPAASALHYAPVLTVGETAGRGNDRLSAARQQSPLRDQSSRSRIGKAQDWVAPVTAGPVRSSRGPWKVSA